MTPPARDGLLYQLDNAGLAIGGATIVAPVSLEIASGRTVGVIGSNGSGKTSLVRMLGRQQQPTSGTIRLLGLPLSGYGDRQLARHIAYMPQFAPPADGMTVRELARLGRFPWHGAFGRFSAEDAEKVEDALRLTDLLNLAGRSVDSLSGGERQRAWLAMMLAQDTRCLLLDEPTSALDVAHQVEMLALVQDLGRERSIGAVIVLHDVNMAARYCDEIIALKHGRVVARGAPEAIVRPDTLAAIYGLAMGIVPHPASGRPISYVL